MAEDSAQAAVHYNYWYMDSMNNVDTNAGTLAYV